MPLPTWTPDLPALDLLLSVAELGSVGRAAAAHRISQPSASSRLARLERQVGATLLIRSSRGSRLTPTGETLLAWSQPVVTAAATLTDGIATLRSDRVARLRVAASLTVGEYLMPKWLLVLRRRHPDLDTAVSVANSHAVADQVREGHSDIGFVESPEAPASLTMKEVGRDRVALVVAANYPLAARASRPIRARDLLDQPLLLREPGSGTRDTFLAALADPVPQHASQLGSTTTIVATALAGGGVGVVSARAVTNEIAAGKLVELRISGVTLERPLRAIWNGPRPTPLARELVIIACAAPAIS